MARAYNIVFACRLITQLYISAPTAQLVEHLKTLGPDIHNNLTKTYSMIGNKEAKFKPNLKEIREITAFHEKTISIMAKKIPQTEIAELCSPKELDTALRLIVDDPDYRTSPPFRATCKNITMLLGDPLFILQGAFKRTRLKGDKTSVIDDSARRKRKEEKWIRREARKQQKAIDRGENKHVIERKEKLRLKRREKRKLNKPAPKVEKDELRKEKVARTKKIIKMKKKQKLEKKKEKVTAQREKKKEKARSRKEQSRRDREKSAAKKVAKAE